MSERGEARRILQLEAEIAENMDELKATLGEIRYQANPKVQARILTEDIRNKVEDIKEEVAATAKDAASGDGEAILKILAVATGTVAVAALVVWRIRSHVGEGQKRRVWRAFVRDLRKIDPPKDIEFTVH